VVSFINNASAVIPYFVLNSRHNIRTYFSAKVIGMKMDGNWNRGDGKNGNGNAMLE